MAGELFNGVVQFGKETTRGTPVAATRKMYFRDPRLTREREARPKRFATGTRDNVRAYRNGPVVAGGELVAPLSASEIIELLLMGIKGGVTPSTPFAGVYLWTFVPGATALEAATVEWQDGARPWREAGVSVDTLKISGAVDQENLVTASLFGMSMTQNALTGSLADRVPDFLEGWETKLYIDNYAGTPGSTNVAGTLINWDITIRNGLQRKYFGDNTNAAGGIAVGELEIDARLTFEAAPAAALTEFNNWDAETKRLVRLEFGQNDVIASTFKRFVTIDIPGAWNAVDLGGEDKGTRVYEMGLQYVYDTTNAYGLQIRAQNARSAAW